MDFDQTVQLSVNTLPRLTVFCIGVSEDLKFCYSFFGIQHAGLSLSASHLSELNIPDHGTQCYSEKDSDYIITLSKDKLQAKKPY